MANALHAEASFFSYLEYDFVAPVPEVWVQYRQAFSAVTLSDSINQFAGEVFVFGDSTENIALNFTDPLGTRLTTWNSINGPFGPVLEAARWYTIGMHSKITAGVLTTELFLDGVNIGPVDDGGLLAADFTTLFVGGQVSSSGEVWVDDIKIGTAGFGSTDIFAADFESGIFVPPFTSAANAGAGGLMEITRAPAFTHNTRLEGPPLWRLLVTDLAGDTLTILDKRSKQRTFLFGLDQPATHTGLVPSDDPEINIPSPSGTSPAYVSHNTRLVYGLRRERRGSPGDDPWVCRFGGIIMGLEDVAADAPTSRYTAYDPWQYLMSRPARNHDSTFPTSAGVRYTDARASVIAVELLANTVAVDGPVFIDASNTGLIEATDVIPGLTKFDQGMSVGEAWQKLCDTGTIDIFLRPIYDPHNRPGKLCELVIKKQLGSVRYDAVFGWDRAGRNVLSLSILADGTRLANEIKLFTGAGVSLPVQTDAASVAVYGQYWSQQFALGNQAQGALALLLALAQLEIRKNGDRTITFTPAPEYAPLAFVDYAIGDYIPLWASRALRQPLGIDYPAFDPAAPGASGYQRVSAIPIDLDDNGVERVNGVVTVESGGASGGGGGVGGGGGGPDTTGRWFSPSSYIDTVVPASPTIDAGSAAMISVLSAGGATSIFTNGVSSVGGQGSATVYREAAGTPTITISLDVPYMSLSTVTFPCDPSWRPTADSDHHMIVIGLDGHYWEFQALDLGAHHAHSVARGDILNGNGVPTLTDRISVLPTPVGLIRPSEVAAGVIPHGLRAEIAYASSAFRAPAISSDGSTPGGIPSGAHLWLPRSVDISALSTNQQIVAVAMREYGIWIGDSGGGFAIYAQSTADGVTSYPFASLTLPNSIVTQLVVLA